MWSLWTDLEREKMYLLETQAQLCQRILIETQIHYRGSKVQARSFLVRVRTCSSLVQAEVERRDSDKVQGRQIRKDLLLTFGRDLKG